MQSSHRANGIAVAPSALGSGAPEAEPRASSPASAALSTLCLIARLHHIAADPAQLAHQLGWTASHVPSTDDLLYAAKHLGLKAKLSRGRSDRLNLAALPALALLRSGGLVMLAQCDGQRVLFIDPATATPGEAARPTIEPLDVFAAQWTGELILITSRASLAGPSQVAI